MLSCRLVLPELPEIIKILEHFIHILCVDDLMVLDDLDLDIQGQFLKYPDIIFLGKYIQTPVHFPEQTGFVLASGSYKADVNGGVKFIAFIDT